MKHTTFPWTCDARFKDQRILGYIAIVFIEHDLATAIKVGVNALKTWEGRACGIKFEILNLTQKFPTECVNIHKKDASGEVIHRQPLKLKQSNKIIITS